MDAIVGYDTPAYDDIGMQERGPGEGEWIKREDAARALEKIRSGEKE